MESRFSNLFWSSMGERAISVIFGGAAIIWGILDESVIIWYAVVGGVITAGIAFLVIRNSGWWKPPLKAQIHQWLFNYQFSVSNVPTSDCEFCFQATDSERRTLSVYQPKVEENLILITMGYALNDPNGGIANRLNDRAKKILCRKLRISLTQKGLGYKNLTEQLGRFTIEFAIPVHDLKQKEFMDAVYRVFEGGLICTEEAFLADDLHQPGS